jgi:hypothetical protein
MWMHKLRFRRHSTGCSSSEAPRSGIRSFTGGLTTARLTARCCFAAREARRVLLPESYKEPAMNTKPKARKSLSLNRETLRTLDKTDVANVVGGVGDQAAAAISWNGTCWSCKSCINCA